MRLTLQIKNDILAKMLPPLSGNDRPAEWSAAKFEDEFGEETLARMVKAGLLKVGTTEPVPVPEEIWRRYPNNHEGYNAVMKDNPIYPTNIEYVTFTEAAWSSAVNDRS